MRSLNKNGQKSLFKLKKILVPGLVSAGVLLFSACSSNQLDTNEQAFLETRAELIEKHSAKDNTFAALQSQVDPNDPQSAEYWRWRIDQYLYGQYPEYQPIYNSYTQGKSFRQIYDLPAEQLGPKKPQPSHLPELPAGYFTENLPGNPHHGAHDLVDNKLYITYQGQLTDPYVAVYDLTTAKWQSGPNKAALSTLSKGERKIDSHGRPIIELDSKGHIHIVYGGHGGEREDGLNPLAIDTPHAGGRMLHVMSKKPYDISQFDYIDDITPFASYTASEKMANGDIYLFTRAGTHKSPWVYYKMENGKHRFEPPVVITWPTPQQENPMNVDTFYITPLKVSDTEIAISSLWHECNFHEIHNKQNYGRINSYYMKLDTTTDTFYNAQNEQLSLPVTLATANQKTLAFDSTQREETPFGTRPIIRDDKKPAVAYQALTNDYREWRMTAFENGQWIHSQPMPGTTDRQLLDSSGKTVKEILSLEVLADNPNTALVIYKNAQSKSVFATAVRENNHSHNWKVNKTHLTLAGTRMSMKPIKSESGNAEAVIVNIKKGASQRLYLWHKGQFRANSLNTNK